ncbi:hypothetical protein B0H17DRAFT_1137392 [Mycena rosella]|uniref:Uncharacterized protein n=1 Tax=Mycena rosella TaxID=1033263 RepID=A0AAD7D8N3_MYCRO|nr:hypothetical protein B0H17DRAFT_1137392 [Mycena rosella]
MGENVAALKPIHQLVWDPSRKAVVLPAIIHEAVEVDYTADSLLGVDLYSFNLMAMHQQLDARHAVQAAIAAVPNLKPPPVQLEVQPVPQTEPHQTVLVFTSAEQDGDYELREIARPTKKVRPAVEQGNPTAKRQGRRCTLCAHANCGHELSCKGKGGREKSLAAGMPIFIYEFVFFSWKRIIKPGWKTRGRKTPKGEPGIHFTHLYYSVTPSEDIARSCWTDSDEFTSLISELLVPPECKIELGTEAGRYCREKQAQLSETSDLGPDLERTRWQGPGVEMVFQPGGKEFKKFNILAYGHPTYFSWIGRRVHNARMLCCLLPNMFGGGVITLNLQEYGTLTLHIVCPINLMQLLLHIIINTSGNGGEGQREGRDMRLSIPEGAQSPVLAKMMGEERSALKTDAECRRVIDGVDIRVQDPEINHLLLWVSSPD